MKYLLIGLLKVYRAVISPLYGNVCKYYPSCSAYALEAVTVHGAVKGTWLAARRLGSCHPWSLGGYDPVPGTAAAAAWETEQAEKAASSTGPDGPSQQVAAARPACCSRASSVR